MRALCATVGAIWAATLVIPSAAGAPGADGTRGHGPPVIVFHAPADSPDSVSAARDGLDRLARRRGTVLIDLSPAPTPPPRAGEALRRAVEAYQELRYARAITELERGVQEAINTGAAGLSPIELSDLFVYRALVETQRGDSARAWEAFLAAAIVAPTRRLDPVRFSPRVIESFQRAVKTVADEAPVELVVDAPSACQVAIDGRALSGLRTLPLRRGAHFARIECPEHQRFATRFDVDAQTTTLRPTLVRLPIADRARALIEARRRGGTSALWLVASSNGRTPTVTLELIDLASGKTRTRAFAPLAGPGAAAALVGEANRIIDSVVTPVLRITVAPPRPWYKQPWVWGVAGVALATAILLPFAIDSPAPNSFDVDVEYPR